jgi:outer membrane protein assembly factor BamA
MNRRLYLAVLAMGGTIALLCPRHAEAQLPQRIERCLPYPTFAQEVADMMPAQDVQKPEEKIVIEDVRFEGDTKLSKSELEKIKSYIRRGEPVAAPEGYEEVAEVSQGLWEDRGYYRAKVTAIGINLGRDGDRERAAIVLQVNAGRLYRMGKINFGSMSDRLVFPESELRSLVGMRTGDVFSAAKIRGAFDRLKNRYGSVGYLDFTSEPRFEPNDADGVIDVYLTFDQGRQFRIGDVRIIGLDLKTESELNGALKPGEVFNPERLDKFLREHRSQLPYGWTPQEAEINRDFKHGTVSFKFDFVPCQQSVN